MTKINGMEVTHPFLPNRTNQRWTTIGSIDVKNLEDGKVQVTNETVNVTVTADTFDEAIGQLNNKVQEVLRDGSAFIGRSNF
jgi:hypothetical protein